MKKRFFLNGFLIACVATVTSVSSHASVSVLPLLQRSECSAAGGWMIGENSVLSCAGNVLLAGGTWDSESAIVVRADKLLWLSDVHIRAPGIDLQAGSLRIDSTATLFSSNGAISLAAREAAIIDGAVSLGGQIIVGSGGSALLSPRGSIVLSPVPEPETLSMWLAGLALLGACRRAPATHASRSTSA